MAVQAGVFRRVPTKNAATTAHVMTSFSRQIFRGRYAVRRRTDRSALKHAHKQRHRCAAHCRPQPNPVSLGGPRSRHRPKDRRRTQHKRPLNWAPAPAARPINLLSDDGRRRGDSAPPLHRRTCQERTVELLLVPDGHRGQRIAARRALVHPVDVGLQALRTGD